MDQKPSFAIKILGWFSVVFLCIGIVFKMQRWPGAGVGLIFGSFVFLFLYLPLWLKASWNHGKKLPLIFQFLLLFLTMLSFILKMMHWPYGGVLHTLWIFLVIFIIFPYSLYYLAKFGRRSLDRFHNLIVFFLVAVLVFGGIRGTSWAMETMANSFSKNEFQIRQSVEHLTVKTTQLYGITRQDSFKLNNPALSKKAETLSRMTTSMIDHLKDLRNHLISVAEGISESKADSLMIDDLNQKANVDVPTQILCGAGPKQAQGPYSGMELKTRINTYRDTVLTLIDEQNRVFISTGINLNTDPVPNEMGEMDDWVAATFDHASLANVMVILENLKYEIKNAEGQVLADIVNTAAKNNGSNFAAKIADMGLYYENQQKQKDIENLKSQQELAHLRMTAKNEEIESQRQTLIWFVLGLFLCAVMIFFIIRSNLIRKKINKQLIVQKQEIEFKNKEITDSINYAKRIQQAILPPVEQVYKALGDSFILYKPKDVVSGDFYAFHQKEHDILIAAADCTGHGVPGAFMSMIGSEQLTKIIIEKNIIQPSEILNELHNGIRNALKQDQSTGETRDGMDIALCKINLKNSTLEYSGANRPLWIIRNGELIETKADKQPIGGLNLDYRKPFTNHKTILEKGDSVYLFTDGYADQFGGDNGKKFMLKNFGKLLIRISSESMQKQMQMINNEIESWKGNNEQVDDILVIGIKV